MGVRFSRVGVLLVVLALQGCGVTPRLRLTAAQEAPGGDLVAAAAAAATAAAAAAAGGKAGDGSSSSSASTGRLSDELLKRYLTNEQLSAWGDEFASRCGSVARKFVIGKSVQGVDLFAVEISDKPGADEPEPKFKYIANMHGDEPSGRMLLPMLAEWLCANNGKDARATRLVKDAHIYLVPTMNPDGFARHTRANADRVDLNRNFPDPVYLAGIAAADLRRPVAAAAPETRAVMNFTLAAGPFAASANLHEGAIVANYPYDGYADRATDVKGARNPSPDDATFQWLARLYAGKHAFMAGSKEFPGGITNGAQWYPVYSGMQDWNYVAAGTMAITLELSERKSRPASDLPALWEENREALIEYALAAALGGARGTVTAARGGAPLEATLTARAADASDKADPVPFYSSRATGFYARPLAPGRYTVTATAPGFEAAKAEVDVPYGGAGAVLDFKLRRAGDGGSGGSSGGGETAATGAAAAGGAAAGGGAAVRNGGGMDAAGKLRASLYILGVHGAVFAALGAASACQSAGCAQAIAARGARRHGGGSSRFEV